jgi:hypothetical protein
LRGAGKPSRFEGPDAERNSVSTSKILRERYEQGAKDRIIVPGQMTPGDMADIALSAMREQLQELYKEFLADVVIKKHGTALNIVNLSSIKAEIARVHSLFPRERSILQRFVLWLGGDKDRTCAALTGICEGLLGLPKRQNDVTAVHASLYPGEPLWQKAPEQSIAELGKIADDARRDVCEH